MSLGDCGVSMCHGLALVEMWSYPQGGHEFTPLGIYPQRFWNSNSFCGLVFSENESSSLSKRNLLQSRTWKERRVRGIIYTVCASWCYGKHLWWAIWRTYLLFSRLWTSSFCHCACSPAVVQCTLHVWCRHVLRSYLQFCLAWSAKSSQPQYHDISERGRATVKSAVYTTHMDQEHPYWSILYMHACIDDDDDDDDDDDGDGDGDGDGDEGDDGELFCSIIHWVPLTRSGRSFAIARAVVDIHAWQRMKYKPGILRTFPNILGFTYWYPHLWFETPKTKLHLNYSEVSRRHHLQIVGSHLPRYLKYSGALPVVGPENLRCWSSLSYQDGAWAAVYLRWLLVS